MGTLLFPHYADLFADVANDVCSDEQFTLRNERYKYINTGRRELLFDLNRNPFEKSGLLDSELRAE